MKGDFNLETLTAEPYVGMPIYLDDTFFEYAEEAASHHIIEDCIPDCVSGCPLAMAYVPWQGFGETYSLEEGFRAGTVFPCLDLPFKGGGRR